MPQAPLSCLICRWVMGASPRGLVHYQLRLVKACHCLREHLVGRAHPRLCCLHRCAAFVMRSVAGSGLGEYSMVGRSHELRHSPLGWVSMRSRRTAAQPARADSDLACSSRLHGVRRGWVLSTFRSSGPWAGPRPRASASSPPSSDALLNLIERESVPPSRTCPTAGGRARASARALSLAA
jgi:hypothetical protein